MIIKCFRCGKDIDTPDSSNADYIMAEDTKKDELRECLVAIKHNDVTRRKLEKKEEIADKDYDVVEVASAAEVQADPNTVRVEARNLIKSIQKTGVVCPGCHKPTDTIIWGVHKKQKGSKDV